MARFGLSTMTVEELCRKLKPVFGRQIDDLYMKYTLSSDNDVRQEIEKALNALYHKYLNESMLSEKILLEPPSEEEVDGEYPLGMITYADKELYAFHMRDKDWVRHMCVCGMSGSGKTNFAYIVIGGLILKKRNFMVFDWKKSFRSLLNVDDKLLCFPIGNENHKNYFRLNINRPPQGVGPKEWINVLVDIISECYLTSFGVHKLLSEVMDEAFNDFGVYKGSDNYPTWLQIKDRLEQKSGDSHGRVSRETEWLASALRIAHSLTFGAFGDTINYKGKDLLSIEELLGMQAVFELDSLSSSEKKFFSEFMLTYIYKMKKVNAESSTDEFKNAIIVDEAHNIFLKDRPNFLKESVTEMIYREVREYGISLICLDQHISKLSDVVAGNSACNIAFQQMLPQDIDTVSSLMQLIQNRKYFSMLPVGSAIVKLAERYHEPFMIRVPFVQIKKDTMSDAELGNIMKERTREFRQYKVFMEQVRPDNIVKELDRMDQVFKTSGVEPSPEFLKQQFLRNDELARIAKDVSEQMQARQKEFEQSQLDPEPEPKPKPIVNHLQKELAGYAKEMLEEGKDIEVIKAFLQKRGYNHKDILVALRNVGHIKPIAKTASGPRESIKPESQTLEALHYLDGKNPAVTEFYTALGLSARKGTRLKIQLEDQGLIRVIEERSRNGWKKRLQLTERGLDLLRRFP